MSKNTYSNFERSVASFESMIMEVSEPHIESLLPEIETDEQAMLLTMQDYTGLSIHSIEADLYGRSSTSYQ